MHSCLFALLTINIPYSSLPSPARGERDHKTRWEVRAHSRTADKEADAAAYTKMTSESDGSTGPDLLSERSVGGTPVLLVGQQDLLYPSWS